MMSAEPPETSSPVCLAHEADDAYMGYATREEIVVFLKELLEAEDGLVRKLRAMTPKVRDEALHCDLTEMLGRHEVNIARANLVLEAF